MNAATGQNKWSDRFINRRSWIDVISSIGMRCRFYEVRSGNSVVKGWHDAEPLSIGEVKLAWQCLSPVLNRSCVRTIRTNVSCRNVSATSNEFVDVALQI